MKMGRGAGAACEYGGHLLPVALEQLTWGESQLRCTEVQNAL